jgi:hypothetical protein
MKNALIKSFLVIVCVFSLVGCATSGLKPPNFASKNLEEGVVVSHPDQIQKDASHITVFPVVFPPELLTECVGVGFVGTWKLLSVDMRDTTKKLVESFVYFKEEIAYEKTSWITPLLEAVIIGKLKEIQNHKFLLANRDGMEWLFSPLGEVYSRSDGYDSNKLETDLNYRSEVFSRYGLNLNQIFNFYQNQNLLRGLYFGEIEIGSRNWQDFEKDLLSSMPYQMEMPDGKIVSSAHRKEQVKQLIQINPRLTGWQRFLERFYLPVITDPQAMAFAGISQVLNHGIKEAYADPEIVGFSANSSSKRKDLAAQFRFLVEQNINYNRQP